MQLRELQRAFQARVLALEPGIEAELKNAQSADFGARLDAYVGGYRTRLVEVLGTTYPILKATLGDDEFERHMRRYIDSIPSRHYSVRHYGADIAQHMATQDPGGIGLALSELARWEWTLADVFDAPDDAPLDVASLAGVPPDAWPSVSFTLRPTVRRLETRTNVVEWWRAANGLCERPDTLLPSAPTRWLLWRRGVKTLFRSLDAAEAAAIDAARDGANFGTICEHFTQYVDEPDVALRAASLLRGWIAEELISRCSWQDTAR
jgi:putative DNA-binding protein